MPNKQSMSTAELVMIWTRQMAAKNRHCAPTLLLRISHTLQDMLLHRL